MLYNSGKILRYFLCLFVCVFKYYVLNKYSFLIYNEFEFDITQNVYYLCMNICMCMYVLLYIYKTICVPACMYIQLYTEYKAKAMRCAVVANFMTCMKYVWRNVAYARAVTANK